MFGFVGDKFKLWKVYYNNQDKSMKKGLWLVFIKIILKCYINKYLLRFPRLSSIFFQLFKRKFKRYIGYNTVHEVVKENKFQIQPCDISNID